MPTTNNGAVELYYETFGNPADPTLLLVNGLGQPVHQLQGSVLREVRRRRASRWCASTTATSACRRTSPTGPSTRCRTWPTTASPCSTPSVREQAHIAGWSMGGMIVQTMALARPERVLSMTSIMSSPGGVPLADRSRGDGAVRREGAEDARRGSRAVHRRAQRVGESRVSRGRPADGRRRKRRSTADFDPEGQGPPGGGGHEVGLAPGGAARR